MLLSNYYKQATMSLSGCKGTNFYLIRLKEAVKKAAEIYSINII